MTDKKKYTCKVVRYESLENAQVIQYDNQGTTIYASGMIDRLRHNLT